MRVNWIASASHLVLVCALPGLTSPVWGAQPPEGFVVIHGDQFVLDGEVFQLKGTNYYPRDGMWAGLWDKWDPKAINREIRMIRGLGMNAVRILVPYRNGGWGGSKGPPADRLEMLEDLVNTFGAEGIRSCVTLFDWETSYPAAGSKTETEHLRYLQAIVPRLQNNPYVLFWDVKNEPDHPSALEGKDDWSCCPQQKAKITSWLERMCNAVRKLDPNHPVSVGLRWWANFDEVAGFVDVAVFHSYWPNIGTEQIPFVRKTLGGKKMPIVVQEFGWPSNPNPCERDGRTIREYSEEKQLAFYQLHLKAFEEHKIAGYLQWMTFDAKAYRDNPKESFEQYFGLWRYDYTLKPAGEFFREHAKVKPFPSRRDSAP
jgi:endo-1,4-beta-mannosidase